MPSRFQGCEVCQRLAALSAVNIRSLGVTQFVSRSLLNRKCVGASLLGAAVLLDGLALNLRGVRGPRFVAFSSIPFALPSRPRTHATAVA
jgi:hypothetical protein